MLSIAVKARENGEPLFPSGGYWFGTNALDDRQPRRLSLQPLDKMRNFSRAALDLYKHAGGIVNHEAAQSQASRQRMHEGAKPNALHDTVNKNSLPTHARQHCPTQRMRARQNSPAAAF